MASLCVSDEIKQIYKELAIKRKYQGLILKLNKDQTLTVEHTIDEVSQEHQEYLDMIPENEPRFVILEIKIKNEDSSSSDDIILITYCPFHVIEKNSKFLYASGTNSLLRQLVPNIGFNFQYDEKQEMTFEKIKAKIQEKR